MFELVFIFVLGLVWLVFATVQDLKTREVANWLNFSLILFALGFRFFYSLFESNWNFLFQGLIGFGIFFVLGNVLYYSRVFAGGDAKLFYALGAILPLDVLFMTNLLNFLYFIVLFLFSGAVYGMSFSLVLMKRNFKIFKKNFSVKFKKYNIYFLFSLFFAIVFLILGFFYLLFLFVALLIFIFPYLFVYAKSVEDCCMIKLVSYKNLREGDWLAEDVKVGIGKIKANWEGLSSEDIKLIRKYKKFVKIKHGIPFVPAFLISYLIFWGLKFVGII